MSSPQSLNLKKADLPEQAKDDDSGDETPPEASRALVMLVLGRVTSWDSGARAEPMTCCQDKTGTQPLVPA